MIDSIEKLMLCTHEYFESISWNTFFPVTDEWYNSSTKDHPIQTLPKDDRWWLVWVQMSCLTLAAFGIMAKMLGKCRSCCKTCLDATCCRSGENRNDEEELSHIIRSHS